MKKIDKSIFQGFYWPFVITIVGIFLSICIGWKTTGTIFGAGKTLLICSFLAIMEISLSFDNAILNSKKLKGISPVWQERFLTWGIIIAVFGMRIIFPIAIICIIAQITPIKAIEIAIFYPQEYLEIINKAYLPLAGFGGTFLMLVSLSFFFDSKKKIHWIKSIEIPMSRLGKIKYLEIACVLIATLSFSYTLTQKKQMIFVYSSLCSILIFLAIAFLERLLLLFNNSSENISNKTKQGLATFIYLEVLDASLSFDGVVSAFALTRNLPIIVIGLSIGAIYVRSMTMTLLRKNVLNEYRYLEHGAFYAIALLSVIMFLQTIIHIPEVITGICSSILIILSLRSSIIHTS
ncbi:Integral membrane protein [Liberibacter crescens BT-1]|uniref:Integral membrane protein n=1 Tax=Liberibacter crescens (strain BT-1) TaxID=1215343 RepID=L0ETV8_LIBCB|nr:DUF475 domain-containing protein [Liberibacter crescens]AGA64974.1 Integral membrane protein [Liberibacter crescens BT-1]AMC12993.1 membrane protein [Liberibacter crescens]